MKKYILFCLLIFMGWLQTFADNEYNYIPTVEEDHEYYKNLGQGLADVIINTMVENGVGERDLANPDSGWEQKLKEIAGVFISKHGWRGEEEYKSLSDEERLERIKNTVRYDKINGRLNIGCGNRDTGYIILSRSPKPIGFDDYYDWDPILEDYICTPGTGYYTTYSTGPWSACHVGSNTWSGNTIACTQTRNVTENYISCTVGCGLDNCQPNESEPSQVQQGHVRMQLSGASVMGGGNVYANNADIQIIEIKLNTPNEGVNWNGRTFTDFQDTTKIKANRIKNSGDDTISMTGRITGSKNDVITIETKSLAPVNTNSGTLSFREKDKIFNISHVHYNFKKTFTGTLETKNTATGGWDGKTTLGTAQDYRLRIVPASTLKLPTLSNYTLNSDLKNNVVAQSNNIVVKATKVHDVTLTDTNGTLFETRVDSKETATTLETEPKISVKDAVISYTLLGAQVSYYLSAQDDAEDRTPIVSGGEKFLGVKIIGNLQAKGKQEFTGQEENQSKLQLSTTKDSIRTHALQTVKSMESGKIVKRVKYVSGDYPLPDADYRADKYDILVVQGGNVTISDNLARNKPFGIIVVQDNSNTQTDYKTAGNIYIAPEVTKIRAAVYADGGLISIDNNGNIFEADSSQRTNILRSQLILEGTLISKNTIGGATFGGGGDIGGKYYLPGQKETDSFETALQYDLNYVRRGNKGCEAISGSDECKIPEPFIIQYDPKIIQAKLPIFTQ